MDVRQLRYALALAEHQHFGRAAAAVGIAQPPLSKAIAQLEGEVGARLFDRTRQGVFPTAAGEALLARARRIDQELTAAALDAQRAARGETGSLRIGFNNSAMLSMLPPVLRRFRVEHPEVRLSLEEMVTVESSRALVAGELDAIVCRGAPRGPGVQQLVSVAVSRDYVIGIVNTGHPFAGQQRISLDQLRRQPLVVALPEDEPAIRKTLRDVFPDLGGWPGVTYAGDTQTIMGLAACGFGVGLGPQDMRTAARSDTWMFDIRPRVALPSLTLAFRSDHRSPSLSALLAVVAETCPVARSALMGLQHSRAEPNQHQNGRRRAGPAESS
jgi:DNA-binding transcriptional LysR family regulator